MKNEILNAIKRREALTKEMSSLVVGTKKVHCPKDLDGNIVGAPIMVFFDPSKNIVFFRTQDEKGDPWGFEYPLPVAEALRLSLDDLLDSEDQSDIESLRIQLDDEMNRIETLANENADLSNEIALLKKDISKMQQNIDAKDSLLERAQSFNEKIAGLWATDKPQNFNTNCVGPWSLFKIEPPLISVYSTVEIKD